MIPAWSIFIRTLSKERHLGALLDSILNQAYPRYCIDIVVVDSSSTVRTIEMATSRSCLVVAIERSRFSFGRSLNIGCEAALGSILVFISGHCVPVREDWLWRLVAPLHEAAVAITYGRRNAGAETKFSEHCLFDKYFPAHAGNGQSPFFCNNANLAIKASSWRKHRFDEVLIGLEGIDVARKVVSGMRDCYVSEASVFHCHHEKWPQVKRHYEREGIALRAIMPEFHLQWHDAVRYFLAGVMGDASKALGQRLFWAKIEEISVSVFASIMERGKGIISIANSRIAKKRNAFIPTES